MSKKGPEETKEALQERGEKLGSVNDATRELEGAAKNFLETVKAQNEKFAAEYQEDAVDRLITNIEDGFSRMMASVSTVFRSAAQSAPSPRETPQSETVKPSPNPEQQERPQPVKTSPKSTAKTELYGFQRENSAELRRKAQALEEASADIFKKLPKREEKAKNWNPFKRK